MEKKEEEKRLYVDVHVIQSIPPSCVNRDDTGSPKTAIYGGVKRARVSSQSWKRAMRLMFGDLLPSMDLGVRTKRIVGMVADEIRNLGSTGDPEAAAKKVLETAGLKINPVENALFFLSIAQAKALAKLATEDTKPTKEKTQNALQQSPGITRELFPPMEIGVRTKRIVDMVADEIRNLDSTGDPEATAKEILETAGLANAESKIKSGKANLDILSNAMFFLSIAQAKALAMLATEDPETTDDKPSKEAKERAHNALKQFPGIDVALFGRMVADDPSLNTDACAQVAHSISTHKISNEYDYFTAVDDLSPADNAGAGHIGTVEFNSSTLYRYATVAVHQLYKQLGDDTIDAVTAFVRAFVCSMPDGKQNTFANRTLPDAVLVALRTDQPINLVGAFEKPVPPSDEGYVTASAKRLVAHARSVYRNFAGEPDLSLTAGELLFELGSIQPLKELLLSLADEIHKRSEKWR
jgi:CRISPR system Cascade subunit CasC